MKKLNSIVFILFLCVFLVGATNEASEDKYYNEGKMFIKQGNLDAALEAFKKILYVNRNHSRSSFALAEIYESQKRFRKAEKEYKYCLKVIPHDKELTEDERETLIQLTENKINELKYVRQTEKDLYKSSLNSIEINVILFGFTICVFLILKVIFVIKEFIRNKIAIYGKDKIWVDRYWERRKGREIKTFSNKMWQLIGCCFLFFIVFYAVRIILKYGIRECYDSIYNAFISLFL